MRISDWSSDVCSSDLADRGADVLVLAPRGLIADVEVQLGARRVIVAKAAGDHLVALIDGVNAGRPIGDDVVEDRAVDVAQGVDGIGFERIRAVRGGLKVRILPVGLGAYVETVRIDRKST